ncbi:MAG: alpha-mannosidase [Chlorobi bacterium CHB2]|nr:alpha-mannosidase [Chlorobi bacterium CHB2]
MPSPMLNAPNLSIQMVGNAHLDPAWMWCWGEGMEAFLSTCRAALQRMEETPEFVFTCSSAAHYRWVEQVEPELFRQIQQRVAEGRWAIVGGWWTQADCNLPSAEGFLRQALLGQRYFLQSFGRIARVGYSPDAFGHTLGLPQLLARSGMPSYIFCRPDPTELPLPSPIIRWHSPDGSSVLAYRVPFHYNMYESSVPKKIADLAEAFHHPSNLSNPAQPLRNVGDVWCLFYGVGNHGGGPTKEHIRQIIEASSNPQFSAVEFSNPERFFATVRKGEDPHQPLPSWHDDLQLNAPGCYSAHSEIKRLNRQSEHLLLQAERLSALATLRVGAEYPAAEFRSAWENVCFNHFHDILCGVAIREALQEAMETYGQALNTARQATRYAIQRIARKVATSGGEGTALLVFNSHSWAVRHGVTFELWHDIDKSLWTQPIHLRVTDGAGNDLPCQIGFTSGKIGKDRVAVTFLADVPAFGWRQYRVIYGQESPHADHRGASIQQQGEQLQVENAQLRVCFSLRDGCITELLHKQSGICLLHGGGAAGLVIDDPTDTWGHGATAFDEVIGRFGNAEVRVVQNGPTHITIRSRTWFGASWIQQDFKLYHHSDYLEVAVKLFWGEQNKMLKLAFPTGLSAPRSVAESAGVATWKPADGTERPCGTWFAASGTTNGQPATLGIATDAKHGFSLTPDGDLRMTVLRSPAYALHTPHPFHPDEDLDYLDQGVQRFHYTLHPVADAAPMELLAKAGMFLNAPLIPHLESAHEGSIPEADLNDGIIISATNVAATVLKRSEENGGESDEKNDGKNETENSEENNGERGGWIVRLHELSGKHTTAQLHFPLLGIKWAAALAPHQLSTWRLHGGTATEVNAIEMSEEEDRKLSEG